MTVLPDHEIRARSFLLSPFRNDQVQPASVDLLLDHDFRVFDHAGTIAVDLGDPASHMQLTRKVEIEDSFVLHPGEFVLASTQERICLPPDIMARVEGKSSLARLGLIVHATAGFIDPGFEGNITLEMTNLLRVPIVLRPGMPICQVSFQHMSSRVSQPYAGNYQGQNGVTESRYKG